MGMHPDSGKPLRWQARIDLGVEEVSHRLVVEAYRDFRARLVDQAEIFDEQQIVLARDAKSADLGVAQVTQVQQLRPGIRGQPQWSVARLAHDRMFPPL